MRDVTTCDIYFNDVVASAGGAGEGLQHLTPEGTQNNTQEVKSDEGLPFYCHPPNPCPKGKTGEFVRIVVPGKFWVQGQDAKCTSTLQSVRDSPILYRYMIQNYIPA